MPAPASEAIASDVGHGAFGARAGLRPFRDLLSETVGQRHLWIELRPRKLMASGSWTAYGGGVYYQALGVTHDGVPLPCVGVRTLTETLSYIEPGRTVTAGTWTWDGTYVWVHLTGDANPANTSVVAEVGVHVGSHGVHQPVLGPDRLTNGVLELWTGSVPNGWTEANGLSSGSGSLAKTTTDPLQGAAAARITITNGVGYYGFYQDVPSLVAGQAYRFSGAYRLAGSGSVAYMGALVYDSTGAQYMQPDGRTAGTFTSAAYDAQRLGEWRRFSYDFVALNSGSFRFWLLLQSGAADSATLDYDDLRLQHIQRIVYHEPLLSAESLPTVELARADTLDGELSSTLGSMELLNGGGYLEPLFGALDWVGAEVRVQVGGRYQLGDAEVLLEDCPVIARACLQSPVVEDTRVRFDLTDLSGVVMGQTLPKRKYDGNADQPGPMDWGRMRPYVFGHVYGLRPALVNIHYPGGGPFPQGIYEVADCAEWPLGILDVEKTYWYLDEAAAGMRYPGYRVEANTKSTEDYSTAITQTRTTGRFQVERDLHAVQITQESNKLHFDIGGSVLTATISLGTYGVYGYYDTTVGGTKSGIVKALTDAMNAAAGVSDILVEVVASTQKVRISRTGGTLNLRCATGADSQTGIWAVLGFDASADRLDGGSHTFNGDNVVYWYMDAQTPLIRCDLYGYVDDASGTYGGVGGSVIQRPCDIAHFLLRVFLKVPVANIDVASFVNGRVWSTDMCGLVIGPEAGEFAGVRRASDIMRILETTGDADLVWSNDQWHWVPRDLSTTGAIVLEDTDFLSFRAGYDAEDLYDEIGVTYAMDPNTGNEKSTEDSYPDVRLRYGRSASRFWRAAFEYDVDAVDSLTTHQMPKQAVTKRRRFTFSVKGKLLQAQIGSKLLVNRSTGLDASGALTNVLVRIWGKRDDWARWISDVEAIEIVIP